MRSLMQAAKFLFHDQSRARPDEGEKACAPHRPDIPPPTRKINSILAHEQGARGRSHDL